MSNRPRTFLYAKNDRFNTDAVEKFGPRVYLTQTKFSPFNVDDIIIAVWQKLEADNFDPSVDFIVLTGPMILVSVLSMAVSSKYPRYKILMFDATQSKYRERIVDTKAFQKSCLTQKK